MNKSLIDRMKRERCSLVSVDLFSGPGGLCTGFKWAGILPLIAVEWTDTTVQTYSKSHNAEILELSKYKISDEQYDENYLKSFLKESSRSVIIHGDINLVSSSMIKELLRKRYGIDSLKETVDVVSGGAPCESFSLAGTRTANDERDDLFSNILRISRTLKSKMILFENVKGMFSKAKDGKKGAIFEYICDSFEDPNASAVYNLVSRDPQIVLLKASDYGVPQYRERLFLVGIRNDLKEVIFSYPEKEYGPEGNNPYVTVKEALADLPVVGSGNEAEYYQEPLTFISENQKKYISIMRGHYTDPEMNTSAPKHLISNCTYNDHMISSHKGPSHIPRKQKLLHLIKEKESMRITYERLTAEGKIDEYKDLFPNVIYGSRNRRLIYDVPSFTITSHCLDEALHPTFDRAITPREAARLQSFPDWYQFEGPYVQFHGDKIQDRYEQIGDAIPPLLAFALAKEIVKALVK